VVSLVEKPPSPELQAAELHFVLASVDRMRILSELQKEELHVNEAAKRLEMTATETLRQFRRMTETGLLQKMPDGKYQLTPYGSLVLENSSTLEFISKHREYLMEHDASLLPKAFRARLGELSNCRLIKETLETLNWVTWFFESAQKRIDATVVGFEIQEKIIIRRIREGVPTRWLIDESHTEKARQLLRSEQRRPEIRVTPRVIGHVAATDKAAVLTLRRRSGELSFVALVGEDPSFISWAEDLYEHLWQRAKPWYP